MSWFKKKTYPEFWEQYLNHFKSKKNTDIEMTRFVVFDTETTGLDTKQDRILSIGTIAVINMTIRVSDSFECYIKQDYLIPKPLKSMAY